MKTKTRFHKLTAWLLTLAMLMTFIPSFTLTTFAADCTHMVNTNGICTTCYAYGYCGEETTDYPNGENVTWTLDSNGLLTISGSGSMASHPWTANNVMANVKTAIVKDGVTTLCDNAFYNCYNLTVATIEGDLDSVGYHAFWCTAKDETTIYFNGNVKKFEEQLYYGRGYVLYVYYNGTTVPEFSGNIYCYSLYTSDVLKIYVTPEYYLKSKNFFGRTVVAPSVSATVSVTGNGTAMVKSSPTSTTELTSLVVGNRYYLSATAQDGYYFKEFKVLSGNIEIDESNRFTVGAENIEIEAVFEAIPEGASKITFDANGGVGEMPMTFVEANSTKTLPAANFSYTYYEFKEWNTKADGSGTAYADKSDVSFSNDTTLYAQWKPITYEVTYDANGGSGTMKSTTVTAGSSNNYTYPENGFTAPEGKMFSGWTRGSASIGSWKPMQPGEKELLSQNYTVYAQWEEPAVEITIGDETTPTKYPNLRLAAEAVNGVESATIKVIRDIVTDS